MTHPTFTGWTASCPDLSSKCLHHTKLEDRQLIKLESNPWNHLVSYPENNDEIITHCNSNISLVLAGKPRIWDTTTAAFEFVKKDHLEQLIASYIKHGYNFLNDLNGSFSLALFDASKQITLLSIDRMGIEQMHYCSTDKQLFFGTSLRKLSNLPVITKSILPQSVFNYFYFHCIPSPNTIFDGIYKLKPAEVLIFKNGSISSDCYWTPTFNEKNHQSVADLESGVKTSLDATMRELSASQQTGAFLSGGTDSSTLAGLLKEHHPADAPVFSIGFEEQGYDEMEYAKIATQRFGNKHYQYYVNFDDVLTLIDKIPKVYEEPFGNSSVVPTYAAATLAKQNGVNHLLGGDGGDELFGGNERYTTQKLFGVYSKVPKLLRVMLLEPAFLNSITTNIPGAKKVSSYIKQAKISMPMRMQTYNILHTQQPNSIFDNHYLTGIDAQQPISLLSDTYNEVSDASLLNKMLYLDWKFTLADNDIRKVNTMCHAADVDVSYPFLDNRVVDSSTNIPSRLKIKGMRLRSFYKDTYSDFLPAEIISKSKHGFGLPFGVWLKKDTRLQDAVYEALTNLKTRHMFQDKFIDDLIEKHRSEHAAYYGTFVWVLAVLELWLNAHST